MKMRTRYQGIFSGSAVLYQYGVIVAASGDGESFVTWRMESEEEAERMYEFLRRGMPSRVWSPEENAANEREAESWG